MSEDMNSDKTALVKSEPQIEIVPNGWGKDKAIARAADGKFAAKNKAAIKKNVSDVVKFFEGKAIDPETGKPMEKTRHEAILDKIFTAMMTATGEDLVGLSKAYAELQRSAFGTKGKDRLLEASDPETNKVKVIVITAPQLVNNEPKETTIPTKPSFIDAEIVSTNP